MLKVSPALKKILSQPLIIPPLLKPESNITDRDTSAFKSGYMIKEKLPSYVMTDIQILDSSLIVKEAVFLLSQSLKQYIVLRHAKSGGIYSFVVFKHDDFMAELNNADDTKSLAVVYNCEETVSAPTVSLQSLHVNPDKPVLSYMGIVIDDQLPVGIITTDTALPVNKMFYCTSGSLPVKINSRGITPGNRAVKKPGKITTRTMYKTLPFDSKSTDSVLPLKSSPKQSQTINLHAEMPSQVKVNKTETLSVELSFEDILPAINSIEAGEKITLSSKKHLTIRAIPKRNLEVLGECTALDLYPEHDKPVKLYFSIKGTDTGAGEIWVVCCQGALCLATMVLKPTVIQADMESDSSGIQVNGIVADDPLQKYQVVNQIDVYTIVNGTGKKYKYVVHFEDVDKEYLSDEFKPDFLGNITALINKIDSAIASTPEQFDSLMVDIIADGTVLFRSLFPEELQRILWDRINTIKYIKLYCEEPLVPWELLYVTEPGRPATNGKFLSELGLVRWAHGYTAPSKIKIRKNKVKFIAPDYMKNGLDAEKEFNILKKIFHAQPISPVTKMEVLKVLSGSVDLLHFAGHGDGAYNDVSKCALKLESCDAVCDESKDLTPSIVSTYSNLVSDDGNRPMIVLNACRSGTSSPYLTSTTGFAQAFLQCKAGAFIGTLWSIEDKAASQFMEVLYTELAQKKGMSEAVLKARSSIKRMNDATFLAYTIYADPFTQLKI